jgi:glycine/D-amino acid oxidase-like deaminating enzyme
VAALGWGLSACAGKSAPADPVMLMLSGPRPRPANDLVPVDASWGRVIHTTVGLRPFREGGFRVEPEKLDDKTIIHNYGHGGGGMSLSWGTAYLVGDMALAHTSRRVAVLGSGAVGIAAARQLQRRGFQVTIYTKALPPHTTSNMSLAGWTPTSRVITTTRRTPQWDEQFRFAAEQAYRELQLMNERDYGVSWIDRYSARDEIPPERVDSERRLLPAHLDTEREILGPGEHPFPLKYATRERRMRIEPAVFLDAHLRDFMSFGGRTVIREFSTPRDLMSLSEKLIVNSTGLGSKDLFDDQEMTPYKGQLTLLAPQSDVNYGTGGGLRTTSGEQGVGLHMTPRRDGIALGGTAERGEWSLEPDEQARQRIVDGHIEFYNAMRRPWSAT